MDQLPRKLNHHDLHNKSDYTSFGKTLRGADYTQLNL